MINLQGDQQALANRLGLNELCISQFISYGKIKVRCLLLKFIASFIIVSPCKH